MRVLLISANRTEINMRTMPLGLACVAQAARRRGHTVKILDLVQEKDVPGSITSAIADLDPEVVGISIRNIDDQEMRNTRFLFEADNLVISLVRQLSPAPIVLGGAGYSIYPEAILAASDADIGIEGEGEVVFNMVLERLEDNDTLDGLPGVHVKGSGLMAERAFIRTPDAFSLPDPDLLFAAIGDTGDLCIPVQTRRGCPMRCSYCSTGLIEGTIIRKRPPKSVVEWIAKLEKRGVGQFYFVDNTFNLPPSYAMALCREMARASFKVKWRCILYPYRLDGSLAEAMAEAGCFEASVGFESANEGVLKKMNKRFRREDVAETCSLLNKYSIQLRGFLLLGGPGETIGSVKESLAFADSLELESIRINVGIRIYPGTALAEQAREEGIIAPDDDLLAPKFYITPGLDENEVMEIVAAYAAGRPYWAI
jgi:radical SAM superfamily enzyme YgiQ (UPF0313 family)